MIAQGRTIVIHYIAKLLDIRNGAISNTKECC